MFNKTSLIAANASLPTQPVFQRREGTEAAPELNPGGPDYGREVEREQVSPPKHQQAPQDGKKHEHKVQYQYHVGSYLIYHLSLQTSLKIFCY